MTSELTAVATYVAVLGVLTQLAMLAIQLRAYLRIRHPSIIVLAVATVVGLVYIGVSFVPALFASAAPYYYSFYALGALLMTVQVVVGIAGSIWLYKGFESASRGEIT